LIQACRKITRMFIRKRFGVVEPWYQSGPMTRRQGRLQQFWIAINPGIQTVWGPTIAEGDGKNSTPVRRRTK